jgi:type I restriction enzyme S subunit
MNANLGVVWPEYTFAELFEILPDRGLRVAQSEYLETGSLPVVDQGEALIGGYTDDVEMTCIADLPVLVFGDHTRRIKYVNFPFAVGAQGTKLLKPRRIIEPRFAYWLLQSLTLRNRGYARHFALLRQQHFRVPAISHQRRVVQILEDHLSRLDVAGAYLAAVSTRQARLVDRYLASTLASLSPPVRPLADVLSEPLSNGRSVPTAESGFPVLRLTALNGGRIDVAARKTGAWTATDAAPFLVRRGDFLISRGNGSRHLVGRGGLVVAEPDPVAYPDTLVRIRAPADVVNPEFLAIVWNGSNVRQQIESVAKTTAGIYKINQKDIQRILLPLPSLPEQAVVVSQVSALQASVERLALAKASVVARGEALRGALLAAAFSGRLTGQGIDLDQREGRGHV